MTRTELQELIEASVEQKLLEMLGDPDEGLSLRKSLRDRLLRQQRATRAGERGQPLDKVIRHLELG